MVFSSLFSFLNGGEALKDLIVLPGVSSLSETHLTGYKYMFEGSWQGTEGGQTLDHD